MGIEMSNAMLFFDIDGTIISEVTGLIADSTREAIKQAQKNGNYVFINTGRTICGVSKEIKEMEFDGYVCGCGTYMEHQDNELFSKTINPKLAKKIVADLRRCHLEGILEGKNRIYYDKNAVYEDVIRIQGSHANQEFPLGDWDEKNLFFDKFVFWEQYQSDYETFYDKYCNDFTFIDRGDNFFEVVPRGYSKASGIQYFMKYLGVCRKDTFAIGDGCNDLPMLQFAENSIAMGNCSKSLVDVVSHVTADTENDGIWKALKHYEII